MLKNISKNIFLYNNNNMVEFGCMFNPDRHNEYYIWGFGMFSIHIRMDLNLENLIVKMLLIMEI